MKQETQEKIKKDEEKQQLKRRFFKSFFVSSKRQAKVYNQIKERAEGDFDFYLMTIFAGIIITAGIIIDSAAVVIGGMLLAPLVWPILAMAVGVCMGRSHLLQKSLITILKSTLVILVVAIFLGLLFPDLVIESNEFLSRTSPTIFELIIGLAAGFIGAFIIAYPKMGSAIAGVVVAAAIVPPIATLGLSLARGDFDLAAGAFLLYLSNLVAITFAATILFLISNFNATSATAEEKRKSGFRWSLLLLIVILVPLILITKQTAAGVKQNKIVKDVVISSLENVSISDMKIQEEDDILIASITIRSKENITADQVSAIENVLMKRMKQPIILKIRVVPVIEAGQNLFDKWQQVKDIDEQVVETDTGPDIIDKELSGLMNCPVSVNNKKFTRMYPVEVGCPICPKIISCSDGQEYIGQQYNEETGLCEEILFVGGTPCELDVPVEDNTIQ
ncbi:TIGR00341 family protein [Candidatus Kuenenbacteria bacterium]|nr:TIGR00341 family protein [Candidatus Kuenenbacteria bacterium]